MAQESVDKSVKLNDGRVRLKEDVTVYGTEKSKFLTTGEPFTVHSAHAEKLVANGMATYENPNTNTKGKEGK